MLMAALASYQRATQIAVTYAGGADKFIHTYVGLTIWLIGVAACRSRMAAVSPWLAVAAAEGGNECLDWMAHGSWRWPDTLSDVAATLFWPTILMLFCRWRRDRQPGEAPADEAP
jgi:hypothetical protein